MTPVEQPDDPDLLRALLASAREERDDNYRQLIESQAWINSVLGHPAYRAARRVARVVRRRGGGTPATPVAASSSPPADNVQEYATPDWQAVLVDALPLDESRHSGIARVTIRLFQELHRATGGRCQLVRPVDGQLRRDIALEAELLGADGDRADARAGASESGAADSGGEATDSPAGRQFDVPAGLVSACVTPGPVAAQWWQAVSAYRRRGRPYLHIVHDLLPITTPEFFDRNLREYFPQWLTQVLDHADLVMTDSQATLDDLLVWIDQSSRQPDHLLPRASVLPLGADIPTTAPPADRATVDPDPTARVLVVGTIEPRKGVEVVLDVAEQFDQAPQQTSRPVQFVLLGKRGWIGRHTLARLEQAATAGTVLWVTDADDTALAELYRSSDLLLAPSRAEGYGLPIVEAQTHGLAVLARDIPVFREVGGDAAAYFATDAELADAVRAALAAPPPPRDPATLPSWRDSAQAVLAQLSLRPGSSAAPPRGDTLGQ